MILYGIMTCDGCRKARRALAGARFEDIRELDDLKDRLPAWHAAAGPRLVNKSSKTWRTLSDADKARAASDTVALLAEHPTLIKRPVIERDGEVFVGWTPAVRAALGVAD